ncbi:Caffeine-induced death protein 2 [Kalmanozyma brasiliensis GHG001]|uniref:Caffeine-induced death protein 2 n=1 Tax=Kalmanozyma brasiliensis (strain GHG001) TaxID=1365824 RepID=UPI002868097B|nr:Caffeine-induced death protein 2 [Kalmanozyma brasiliensis GHG001]KAF6767319.1 Caffeine-induced death protein 2 [Kalmanozyma brasiliensis GHG001]
MSTWVSPSMSRFNRHPSSPDTARESATSTQYEPVQLGSSSVLKPLTPPNVSNLTPSTCLAIGEFKDLLRQYRQLDDGITTRLNRSFARSRALGQSSSPTLLSSASSTSASSSDLGTSTYATPAPGACAAFWRELVDVWIGREEAVRFCIAVADATSRPNLPPASASNSDRVLDADYRPATRSEGGERWSRAENSAETLARQLHNELKIESIIRARSLDAFKSRCRFFTPSPPAGPDGDRERAMWAGRPTPAAEASAQGAVRP